MNERMADRRSGFPLANQTGVELVETAGARTGKFQRLNLGRLNGVGLVAWQAGPLSVRLCV